LDAPSPPAQDAAGLVLAGGRSIRFGGEKAAALFGGAPLVLRAAGRLAAACAQVAINARPGSAAESLAGRLPVLHDRPGDPEGPLAGIRAGLAWARGLGAASLAVIPCDAPVAPDDLVTRLIAQAGGGAAMAETEDGAEPLFAVWPVWALHRLDEAIDRGAHPPTWRVLHDLGAARVRFAAADLVNINTREDLEALLARLG
jgi:molybdopterin-guanine dinucleotide biosynthesis protein A